MFAHYLGIEMIFNSVKKVKDFSIQHEHQYSTMLINSDFAPIKSNLKSTDYSSTNKAILSGFSNKNLLFFKKNNNM